MLWTGLSRYRDLGLLILRIGIGLAFIGHGWPKLSGGPEAWAGIGGMLDLPIPVVFGFLAALIEFGCGILFALGLLFRPATILLALQMLAAMSWHLYMAPSLEHYSPAAYAEGWSHPMKMAILFIAMAFIGPGSYSIDRR